MVWPFPFTLFAAKDRDITLAESALLLDRPAIDKIPRTIVDKVARELVAGTEAATVVKPPNAPSGCDFTTMQSDPTSDVGWINRVTWTDNSADEDGFAVEKSTNGGSFVEIAAATAANATQFDDGAVQEHDQYAYRVRAFRQATTKLYSAYSTSATKRAPLMAPDTLVATVIDFNSVKLDWNDNSFDGDRVKVYRNNVEIADIASVSPALGGGANSFTDNSAPSDSTITYEVRAFHAATGNLSQDNAATATATTPATNPSGVSAADVSVCTNGSNDLKIRITWSNGASSSGWTTHVQRNDPALAGWFDMTGSTGIPLSQNSYTHEDPAAGNTYTYRVRHEHTDGRVTDWVQSNAAVANNVCPSGTPAIVATDGSDCNAGTPDYEVNLSWTPLSGWNVRVEFSENSSTGPWSLFNTFGSATSSAVHDHANMGAGDAWYYRARYEKTGSTDNYSAVDGATLADPCCAAPAAPSALSCTSTSTSISLSWADNSNNEDGFEIWRDGSLYATNAANDTTYTDGNPTSGVSHSYKVRAFMNCAGGTKKFSTFSNSVACSTDGGGQV